MGRRIRPKIRFGDLPSDDSSDDSDAGGGVALLPLEFGGNKAGSSSNGGLSIAASKNEDASLESDGENPGQVIVHGISPRVGMPNGPDAQAKGSQHEVCTMTVARTGQFKLQSPSTSNLNPASAEFKPAGIPIQPFVETSFQGTCEQNPAPIHVFVSLISMDSNFPRTPPEYLFYKPVPDVIPGQNTSRSRNNVNNQISTVVDTTSDSQQNEPAQLFRTTGSPSQDKQSLATERESATNMNPSYQPSHDSRFITNLEMQQSFPAQITSQAGSQVHAGNVQQQPSYGPQYVPQRMVHGDNDRATPNNYNINNMQPMQQQQSQRPQQPQTQQQQQQQQQAQQQICHGRQPMPMSMGAGQNLSSAPSSNQARDQAAMNALQAHLSRVEAEQATNDQFSNTGTHRFQTPVRSGAAHSSTARMTPSSYRFTPRSSVHSDGVMSPNGQMGSMSSYTEPRNYAPRSNGSMTNEQPPRFNIQATNAQGAVASQQHQYGDNRDAVAYHNQQQGNGFGSGISLSKPGSDPFSTVPTGGQMMDPSVLFKSGTQTALSHIIEPIEPISNALVQQNHHVPDYIRKQRSKHLNQLTSGPNERPTADVALHADNFPFIEGARCSQPSQNHGVVKFKSIPFSVTRAEIVAFLGRNSKILNDTEEPVHIIMESVCCKTNDAYVEFMSAQAAVAAVERHRKNVSSGRHYRLGDRAVELELSSQTALMKDLFNRAKGVRWEGARPAVLPDHPTEPWNRFKGFIAVEQMTMLKKHVDCPQRSPYSRECPQRPFETIISIMAKLPWYMTEHITIVQRWAVYDACCNLLRFLKSAIKARKFEGVLNQQLYRRLWTTGMLCHGFTVTMKDEIAFIVGLTEDQMRDFNMPRFGHLWAHIYSLVPKPGRPLDLIEWYIAIIREETDRWLSLSPPNVQNEIRMEAQNTCMYWGYIFKEAPLPHGEAFDNMTLAAMADRDFTAITNILKRALNQ